MNFAKIIGSVVSTQKVQELVGIPLKIIEPCDAEGRATGRSIVAVDSIGARVGDHVIWVGKREASLAIPEAQMVNRFPVDAAVVGIVDDIG